MAIGVTHVDVSDLVAGIDAVRKSAANLRPAWSKVRPLFRADLKDHFVKRSGPEGAWPGPAPATVEKVRRQRGSRYKRGKRAGQLTKRGARRLSRALGKLKTSFKMQTTREAIEAVSKVSWAGVHQFGGVAGHGARIPKRTFAWVSNELVIVVANQIRDHVMEPW